ncbi:hypothetical protein L1987_72354 [Smallanthus sonchifolius]|uniref:Uncharacterized protein n=1 Tax=Smallanthus sonchifolius TaxID=185202 RepID=A0ACB9AVN7_9ASTR|nr:hypothetical protein L1987_72354 [Smallanthus sonchifolius]
MIETKQNTFNRKHFILVSEHDSLYSLLFNHRETVSRPTELCLQLPYVDVFTFCGSCNGLVLVSAQDNFGDLNLIVLNPMTSGFVQLPDSRYSILDHWRKTDFVFGFGYDSMTDDYKVVTVSFFRTDLEVYVYSLKTNSWKWVTYYPFDHAYYGKDSTCVFVNGVLHWIDIENTGGLGVIVAFSLTSEIFTELPLPISFDAADSSMAKNELKLVVGEKLAIFMKGEIWVMNNNNNNNNNGVFISWTEILLHGLNEVPAMVFYDDGKFLVVSRYEMLMYNIEDGSLCRHTDSYSDMNYVDVRGFFC